MNSDHAGLARNLVRNPLVASYRALAGTAFEKEVSSERGHEIDQYQ